MRVLLLLAIAICSLVAKAQTVVFNFNDGTTVSYPITEVRSTDFEGANMRVFLWDGTTYSWSMSSVTNYQFNDLSTGVVEDITALTPLVIYPNPTSGGVTIGFEVHGDGEVQLEVLDTQGALVKVLYTGRLPQGAQQLHWDGHNAKGQPVAAGNYLCRMVQGPRAASKQLIVQH